MKISNIKLNNNSSLEKNFKGSLDDKSRVRYKHFEQLNDDVLSVRSIIKAHKQVEQSKKMKVFKAIPTATATLIGTSIAMTQPGKLSNKIGAGLGFLVILKSFDVASDMIEKLATKKPELKQQKENKQSKAKTALKVLGGVALASLTAIGVCKGKEPIKKFITKEFNQIRNEIDTSKLAKFTNEKVTPFIQKHQKLNSALSIIAPLGILSGSSFAQIKLSDSLSKDLKTKSKENFIKGKEIQKIAREHFDSIDAIEV